MSNHHHHTRRSFLGRMSIGCCSLGFTSLLSGISNMGLMNAAVAANRSMYQSGDNYKALVCLFLNGGNDSFNMLVPRGTCTYQEYADVRKHLAIPKENLLPIKSNENEFGLHPKLKKIQKLYNEGNVAFLANVGALVAPTNLVDYRKFSNLPVSLYSHTDQLKHWQTSVPQDTNASGWGGRLGDILQSNNRNQDISMNISLDGVNIFQQGKSVNSYSIKPVGEGSVMINGARNNDFYNTIKRQTLDNILDQNYNNILSKAYAETVTNANENSYAFSTAISGGTPITTAFAEDELSQKLKMVARTIASRKLLEVKNQTFFVELNGFDNHSNVLKKHKSLLENMDTALGSFFSALIELGVEKQVTTFTISDFGRRLAPNESGSDHGWGGHALMMGGAVKGGKIYGEYPDLYIGNSLDTGNGRLIPTTSCDEYFAELALWLGASSGDLDQIFPNINNFWSPSSDPYPIGFLA